MSRIRVGPGLLMVLEENSTNCLFYFNPSISFSTPFSAAS